MAFAVPDPYREAVRNGVALFYTVDASVGGVPVEGATGLAPTGGSITDTTKPGVRRVLSLDLAGDRDLFERLSPIGTQLRVTAHVRYTDRRVIDIPMGVFDVDSEKISEGGGGLSLTAPDKWVRIQRARFLLPQQSYPGMLITDAIAVLIRGALGADEPVLITSTSTASVGTVTWEKDRDKAIMDMAAAASVWVYFDRNGLATIADVPSIGAAPDWLVDASASGVMTSLDRERSRANTYNVVMVESSAAEDLGWGPQIVWDNDASSPTFAGPDPLNNPGAAGPFGIVPYFYSSPLLTHPDQARAAGGTVLARTAGLASQVSLGQVPNPALDAWDVLEVMPPAETAMVVTEQTVNTVGAVYPSTAFYPSAVAYPNGGERRRTIRRRTVGATSERHVADTVTHPLGMGEQHIDGRSTRTDEYTS